MAFSDTDLQNMSAMFSAALQQFGRDLEGFNRKAKEAAGSEGGMSKLSEMFVSMGKHLVGPVGLAAGIYEVAKSLEEFSEHEVRMANFAKDTGFATENVEAMQQAMRRMGMSVNEANNVMANLGGKLSNLRAFKESSELFQNLSRSEGGAAFAYNLLRLEQAGDRMGSLNLIIRTFNRQTVETQILMAGLFGVGRSVLANMSDEMERNIKVWHKSEAEVKKYHELWIDLEASLDNIFGKISDHGVEAINDLAKELGKGDIDASAHKIANAINRFTDILHKAFESDLKDLRMIKHGMEDVVNFVNSNPIIQGAHKFLNKTPTQILEDLNSHSNNPEFDQALKNMKDRTGETAVPGNFTFNDLAGKTTEGNVLLGDIRDILKRIEDKGLNRPDTGGTGGVGGGPGLGIGPGGVDLGKPGLGGVDRRSGVNKGAPGSGPVQLPSDNLIDRKAGEHPFEFQKNGEGTLGSGVPEHVLATARKVALEGGPEAVSRFMAQQGYPKNGNWCGEFAAAVVRGAGGTPPRNPQVASNWRHFGHETNDPVPGDIAVRRGAPTGSTGSHVTIFEGDAGRDRFMGIGGNQGRFESSFPKSRYQFFHSDARGNPDASSPDVSSAKVKGSFFTDHRTASGADASKEAGIALPSREHLGEMFNVTGPDGRTTKLRQIDIGPAKWTGRGIDFSGPAKDKLGYDPTDKSFTYSLVDERNKMDKVQTGTGSIGGKVHAAIEFLNVPNNVKTTGEASGEIFKDLQINRTRQAGVYRSGPQAYE